jgi:hypothetical protein
MKSTPVQMLALLSMAVLAAGCAHDKKAPSSAKADDMVKIGKTASETDTQIVLGVRDAGVRSAIISEHTLYPYPVVQDGDTLNSLGERDLSVLAGHLRDHPNAPLNVRRGGAGVDNNLYDARVRYVMQALAARGVKTDQLRIGDTVGSSELARSADLIHELHTMRTDKMYNTSGNDTSTTESDQTTSNTSVNTGGQQQ